MNSLTMDRPVAARKRKDPASAPEPVEDSTSLLSIKLASDVVKTARIVASLTDVSMSDLLAGILRPILKKMEDDGFAKRRQDRCGKGAE